VNDNNKKDFIPQMPTSKPKTMRESRGEKPKVTKSRKPRQEKGAFARTFVESPTQEIRDQVLSLRKMVLPAALTESWDSPWLEHLVMPLAEDALKTLAQCDVNLAAKGKLELLRIFLLYLASKNKSNIPQQSNVTVNVNNQEKSNQSSQTELAVFLGINQDPDQTIEAEIKDE
jgi:hypothetical protein